jgi:hypothetical protein
MRHDPASGALIVMLRSLKMHGMAQAVGELTEQGSPAFEAAVPILSQLLKAEMAEREVRSTAYQLKAAPARARRISPPPSASTPSSITASASGFSPPWNSSTPSNRKRTTARQVRSPAA